mgnify:FL=1
MTHMITQEAESIQRFLAEHEQAFEEMLFKEAKNKESKIREIQFLGNINLVKNAHLLTKYVMEQDETQLLKLANTDGKTWAKYSLTLSLKLEWVHAIRRTIWYFLQKYEETTQFQNSPNSFYEMEKYVNDTIDQFLNAFFIAYSRYKDELIETQKLLVENLSVPIIPITKNTSVLPLIGELDTTRMSKIEEKTLVEIGKNRIQQLVIDFSGVVHMEEKMGSYIIKIIDGAGIMGCKITITGLRPDIIHQMIKEGHSTTIDRKANMKVTLQQALQIILREDGFEE